MLTECPIDPALRKFVVGELPPDESTLVSEHVKTCSRCAARIQVLECAVPATNVLLDELRCAALPEAPSDPEFQAAVQNLLAIPTERGLRVGDVIDDYRLVELLGEGGMGVVYRAVHTHLEKEFALKVIRRTRTIHPQAADRFSREMKAVGKLKHDNLVNATGAGVADGVQYLVMDFVSGTNLARLVYRDGPLPLARACDLVRQAARGLHHAHQHGLVHRDVKPSNLLLGSDGIVRVLDLGLALLPDELPPESLPDNVEVRTTTAAGDGTLTSPGQQLGTQHYTAPEQLEDSHRVDHRADIYGLGCTLSYLLTGQPPAAGKLYPAELPRELWEKFLAARPAARFPSMLDVAESLAPYCAPDAQSAAPTPTPTPTARARRGWFLPAALLATAALGGTAVLALNQPTPTPTPEPEVGEKLRPTEPRIFAEAPLPRAVPPRGLLPMTPDEARAVQKQWADHIRQPVAVKNSVGMELVLIPPGEFGLYSTYQVTLTKPYRMATLEVTRAQFAQFVAANPGFKTDTEAKPKEITATFSTFRPLAEFPHPSGKPVNWRAPGWGAYRDDQPITYLTWDDVAAFLTWLSAKERRTYRLPTQAEWAWACRAGTATRYYWGNDVRQIDTYAWTRMASVDRPQSVGRLKPNDWGLHDVLGNVAEMVQDYHIVPLPAGRAIDPVNATVCHERIVCGGGYMSLVEFSLDTLPASAANLKFAGSTHGFRVVLEP